MMKNDVFCQRLVAFLFCIAFVFCAVGASGFMQSEYNIFTFLLSFGVASLFSGIILLLLAAVGYCYSPSALTSS
jgi:hypothetical protein